MGTRAMLLAVGIVVCLGLSAQAAIVNVSFPITVSQEVAAPAIPGLQPAGVGFVTFDDTSNLLTWMIYYAGMTGPIVSPGVQLEGPAPIGSTGVPQVSIAGPESSISLPQPASGALAGSKVIDDTQESQLLSGQWYVNFYTARNPSGEIRGQVPLPEPSTIVLVVLAGGLLLRRRG